MLLRGSAAQSIPASFRGSACIAGEVDIYSTNRAQRGALYVKAKDAMHDATMAWLRSKHGGQLDGNTRPADRRRVCVEVMVVDPKDWRLSVNLLDVAVAG